MPPEEGPPRRSDAHPTASGAARSCLRAGGRWARLLAGRPGRRARLRAARTALGAEVGEHLRDGPAPMFLAMPLAIHRAAAAELAAGGAAAPAAAGAVRRRLAARRMRAADAQLGAWASGLADPPAPELAAAHRAAGRAGRAVDAAEAELAASRRAALASARLTAALAVQAVADVVVWTAAGLASGVGMIRAWLVSLWVRSARRLVLARRATVSRLVAARDRRRGRRAATRRDLPSAGRHGPPGRHERDALGWRDAMSEARRSEARPGVPNGTEQGVPNGTGRSVPSGKENPDGSGGEAGSGAPPGGAQYWWTPGEPEDEPPGRAGREAAAAHATTVRLPALPDAAWNGHAAATRPRDPVLAAVSGFAAAVARPVRRFGRRTARWLAPLVVAVAAPPNRARRPWAALIRPVVAACALSLVLGMFTALPTGVVMAGSVKAAGKGLPDLADLRPLDQPERTEVFDVNGRLIEVLKYDQDRIVVPLEAVPATVQSAVVAAEDARFYEHRGVDQRGIMRALFADLSRGEDAQGGSTITQQLVRNAYPHLKERSLVRKVREAALAAELERKQSKPKILEQYLNRVYFGGGYYGIEAASLGYFYRHVGQLSLAQAALLAGVIRSPETANPRANPTEALRLRDSVLDRMVELGMEPADLAARARREKLGVKKRKELPNGRYRWFLDGVKQQLLEDPRLGRTWDEREKKLYQGGLRIYTTLNPKLQADAEQAVRRRGPTVAGPDVALVAMIPSTGAVRAVVGGRDLEHDRFNLALQGHRQAGSSFKPFVLASALENGISPDSVWGTSGWAPRKVCGVPWGVSNYEGQAAGQLSVRVATWHSVNGVYGRLMEQLCPAKVVDMARRLGVRVAQRNEQAPSIALGSAEVYPIDMAAAYATFADMGVYHKPNFVTRVVRHGQLVLENNEAGERRIPATLAYEVNDVLKGVISQGTGTAAQIGRPEAGKTGTTQDYHDAWFVGYTPQLATAVWMGYPDRQGAMRNIGGVRTVVGGTFPAGIWHDFMQEALADTQPLDWQRPEGQLPYTVLPPPPPATTTTIVPGQPQHGPKKEPGRRGPGSTLPPQTIPPIFGTQTTVVQGAPVEPRRPAGAYHRRK